MDRKLVKQLNNLRSNCPDPEWKKNNRNILMSQIYATSDSSNETDSSFFARFSFLKSLPQPMVAVFLICVVIAGGGVFGLNASHDAIPGDSLYIAKKLNEKAKLAFTFDEEKKTRLGLEFAGERVKEIKEVLRIEENGGKEEKVNQLVSEFKKEIQVAKSRLENRVEINGQNDKPVEPTDANESGNELAQVDLSESEMLFTAGLERDERGLQVSPGEISLSEVSGKDSKDGAVENGQVEIENRATTSMNQLGEASSSSAVAKENEDSGDDIFMNIDTLVAQTEELSKKEYLINSEDLENLEAAIDQITEKNDNGEVRGVNEQASTTNEAAVTK